MNTGLHDTIEHKGPRKLLGKLLNLPSPLFIICGDDPFLASCRLSYINCSTSITAAYIYYSEHRDVIHWKFNGKYGEI